MSRHTLGLAFEINKLYRRSMEASAGSDHGEIITDLSALIEIQHPLEQFEITSDMLGKIRVIYLRLPDNLQGSFCLTIGNLIEPKTALFDKKNDITQREKLAFAFLGACEPFMIPNEKIDVWARAFSPKEIALVCIKAIPQSTGSILLAHKLVAELSSQKPKNYSFIFKANSPELASLEMTERQKYAYSFLANVEINLRSEGFKYSPAQTIALLFGDVIIEEPDFNASIIAELTTRITQEKFDELSTFKVPNGFGSSTGAKGARTAKVLVLDAAPNLGINQSAN